MASILEWAKQEIDISYVCFLLTENASYMKDQPSTCCFKSLSIHFTEIQTLSFDQNYLRKFAILGFTNDK